MSLTHDPNTIFRDHEVDGVPSSGKHEPRKSDIRALLYEMQQVLIALAADAGEIPLPNLLIRYTITGGDENAIEATPNLPVPDGPALALFSITIEEENTGPVTINGKPLKLRSGADVPSGYLTPGLLLFMDTGGAFVLLTYGNAEAVEAAILQALADAEAAAEAAEGYAAGVNLPAIQPGDAGKMLYVKGDETGYELDDAPAGGGGGGDFQILADRVALKALTAADGDVVRLSESGRRGDFMFAESDLSSIIAPASVTSTSIDSGTETITSAAHGLKTGEAVMPTTSVNGLTSGALYYVIRVSADTFRLASSRANALAGTEFDLTGTTNFTVKAIRDDLEGVYVIPTALARDGSEGAWVRQFDGDNYDPRWFGAACDAATDDWPAFFTMIALMPSGKCIRMPIGLCGVSRTLEIAKDISIVGVSKSRSGFMALGFSSGAFILDWLGTTTDRIQNIVLAEFTLRSDNQLAVGMRLTWVNKSEFRNLFFYNLRHGVNGDNAWSNLWSGFSTYAIAFTTYRDLDEGNNVTFRGCQFRGEVGYWASGNAAGVTFENCDFEDITSTSGAGIRLAPTTGKRVTGVMVSGGYWEMIKGRAIQCDGADADSVNGLTVTGAYFYGGHVNKFSSTSGQAQHAISLGNTAGFSIVANYFFDWETAAFLVSLTATLNGIISDNITRQTAALRTGDLDGTVESTRNRVI